MFRRASVLAVVVVMLAFQPSGATPPGANGKLACEGIRGTTPGSEVVTFAPDGSGETVLTSDPARDGDPSWSPDGMRIAFESFRTGHSELWTMNADGTGLQQLTFNGPAEDRGSSWSPDGTQIVFHSGVLTSGPVGFENLEIYTINADGTGLTQLTSNAVQDSQPAWSPDGTKIAFTSNRDIIDGRHDYQIYVMNTDGTNVTRLTSADAEDAHATWSPDGTKLAFHSRRAGGLDIFTMNADGTGQVPVTSGPTWEFFPVWSPDGTKIAYNGDTLATDFDVYTINTDGSGVTRLTTTPGFDGRCDWTPATPTSTTDCAAGGWERYNTGSSTRFRNQGECVAFVATRGASGRRGPPA